MGGSRTQGPVWLPLGQAAKRLGVHPTTLRRWAENGDFPVMITPGGHRRFAESDLQRYATARSRQVVEASGDPVWRDSAVRQVATLWAEQHVAELGSLTASEVAELVDGLCRNLVDAVPDSLGDLGHPSAARLRSRQMSLSAANTLIQCGVTLTDATEIAFFLRDVLPDSVSIAPAFVQARPEAQDRLRRHLLALTDGVQLAICDVWEDAQKRDALNASGTRRYGRPTRQPTRP